jgi:aspartate carbamoyltransferase catalytic subunit
MHKINWKHKDLLGIYELTREEIEQILDLASSFKEISERDIKKVPTLRGKTIVNLFYEPSTRTRASFEIAAKRLSADVLNISPDSSSIAKGESLKDTGATLRAMGVSAVVIRHPMAGSVHQLANYTSAAVINAGDGAHEHPTQALVDLFVARAHLGPNLEGIEIAIIGDILHSRVARSGILAFAKLGAKVTLISMPQLIPPGIEKFPISKISYSIKEGIKNKSIIILLRLQKERHKLPFLPSSKEYRNLFCLTEEILKEASSEILIMHPGPVNRDIELEGSLVDSAQSLINEQVNAGIAVRMAVLYLLVK